MTKKKYNVLIIGAGNIGSFFDTPSSSNVLSHAHAFSTHSGFSLVGFVDKDLNKAKRAATLWGGDAFADVSSAFRKIDRIDVVCNATPDEMHYKILKEVLHYPVKLIFTEKPITKTLSEARDIQKLMYRKKADVAVDYTRRFVPEFIKLSQEIRNGLYGDYVAGSGYYGKGIIHNGSHMIDLLQNFFGSVGKFVAIKKEYDFSPQDPSVTGILDIGKKKFFLQHINKELFTIFDIDLIFTKAHIRIANSGFLIEIRKVEKSKTFRGYKSLGNTVSIKTSLSYALSFAVDNIYRHLQYGDDLKCSLREGYNILRTVSNIME